MKFDIRLLKGVLSKHNVLINLLFVFRRTHIFYLDYSYDANKGNEEAKNVAEEDHRGFSNNNFNPASSVSDVTLVAQLSMDRLHMVEDLCR